MTRDICGEVVIISVPPVWIWSQPILSATIVCGTAKAKVTRESTAAGVTHNQAIRAQREAQKVCVCVCVCSPSPF
jgi:hypothetical protein